MREQEYPNYTTALDALQRSLGEDVKHLRALVLDEDMDCIARNLRAERLRAFEYVMALIDTMRTWEW